MLINFKMEALLLSTSPNRSTLMVLRLLSPFNKMWIDQQTHCCSHQVSGSHSIEDRLLLSVRVMDLCKHERALFSQCLWEHFWKCKSWLFFFIISVFVSVSHCSSGLGAVLLLPLLDYHLCRLSERLESHCSATAGGSDSAAMSSISLTSIASTDEPGRAEGTGLTGFSVEEIGLAALRLLYLLVSHSDEVMS